MKKAHHRRRAFLTQKGGDSHSRFQDSLCCIPKILSLSKTFS